MKKIFIAVVIVVIFLIIIYASIKVFSPKSKIDITNSKSKPSLGHTERAKTNYNITKNITQNTKELNNSQLENPQNSTNSGGGLQNFATNFISNLQNMASQLINNSKNYNNQTINSTNDSKNTSKTADPPSFKLRVDVINSLQNQINQAQIVEDINFEEDLPSS